MPRSAEATALPPRPLRLVGGIVVAVAVTTMIVAIFATILAAAARQPAGATTVDLGYLLWITGVQAILSTVLSLAAGMAVAWALNRLRFPGRTLLVGLFASAIVTPGLVIAFGLLSVWGRGGWFGALGIPMFGLWGVVSAHVILDGAFAARILLSRLDTIPEARLKTGQSLGLSAVTRFAVMDWPVIAGAIPGLAAIIFLLAFTSFPIVLLLGGGPTVQTLEVAIYAAVRLDFDLALAVKLALIQVGLCSVVILVSTAFAPVATGLDRAAASRWRDGPATQALQWTILTLATLAFVSPLLAVLLDGLRGLGDVLVQPAFWNAVLTSVWIAAASAIIALLLGLAVATARAASTSRLVRTLLGAPAYAYLAVPAVTLSLGAFLLVRDLGYAPAIVAPWVVVLANALLTLPFAIATLSPTLDAIVRSRGKLMRSLGLGGARAFSEVEWPLIAPQAGLVLALGFCFSLGDLGVIALFGTQDFATLPLLMVRALGAYRSNDAAAVAAFMLVLTLGAFVILPRLFERLTDARA